MSDIDPQSGAEQLDEEELPQDVIPEKFIEPEEWDSGAGADEQEAHQDSYPDEDGIGQERQTTLSAEEAAMHVEPGISSEES